jgi:outer membrane immunogenic protein
MKILSILAAAFVATTAATAADLPRRNAVPVAVMAPAPVSSWTGFYAGAHLGYGSSSPISGILGGLQVGYDQQFGSIVAGIAADYSLANITGSTGGFSFKESGMGSVRARLGVAVSPQFLLYGTGGFAFSTMKGTDALGVSISKSHNGYTLGLGGEYKIDRNWAAFAEYRFNSMATQVYSPTVSLKYNENNGRVGVNYRF